MSPTDKASYPELPDTPFVQLRIKGIDVIRVINVGDGILGNNGLSGELVTLCNSKLNGGNRATQLWSELFRYIDLLEIYR